MSFYVGPLISAIQSVNWHWPTSAYLIADTEEELHAFASKLGLKRSWFHRNHYDLTASMRNKAIAFGAINLQTLRAVGLKLKEIKEGRLGTAASGDG